MCWAVWEPQEEKQNPNQLRGAGPGDPSLARMERTKAQKAAPLDHKNPDLGQSPGTMPRASREGIWGWGCRCTQAEVRETVKIAYGNQGNNGNGSALRSSCIRV